MAIPALLDPASALGVRLAAALFFGWAAIAKGRDLARFRAALAGYQLLPRFLLHAVALLIPSTELAIALALPFAALAPWPQLAGAALLLVFAAAMAINLVRGRREIDCGCSFGATDKGLRWSGVARNVVVAAAIVLGGSDGAPASLLQFASGILTGFAVLALVAAADAISALYARSSGLKRTA